ncbi:MAG: tetratricopeptide repeat protein [Candidatus Kariarchaeaceae archaeon]|jgi:tetratricopeptide (TPR) repeat protein
MLTSDLDWENSAKSFFFEKDFGFAEYCFKRVCRNRPSGKLWYLRGLSFKFQRLYDSALFCLRRALAYDYNQGLIMYHIGSIFAELGDYEEAIFYLEKAEGIGVSGKRARIKKLHVYLKYNKIKEYAEEIVHLNPHKEQGAAGVV